MTDIVSKDSLNDGDKPAGSIENAGSPDMSDAASTMPDVARFQEIVKDALGSVPEGLNSAELEVLAHKAGILAHDYCTPNRRVLKHFSILLVEDGLPYNDMPLNEVVARQIAYSQVGELLKERGCTLHAPSAYFAWNDRALEEVSFYSSHIDIIVTDDLEKACARIEKGGLDLVLTDMGLPSENNGRFAAEHNFTNAYSRDRFLDSSVYGGMVIQSAKNADIPFSVFTSNSHCDHALNWLSAEGIIMGADPDFADRVARMRFSAGELVNFEGGPNVYVGAKGRIGSFARVIRESLRRNYPSEIQEMMEVQNMLNPYSEPAEPETLPRSLSRY